jgi:hypothetical protein
MGASDVGFNAFPPWILDGGTDNDANKIAIVTVAWRGSG